MCSSHHFLFSGNLCSSLQKDALDLCIYAGLFLHPPNGHAGPLHTSCFEIMCVYRVVHRDPDVILWVPHKPFTDGHGGYHQFSVVIAWDLVQMRQELLKASATLMMVSTEQFSPGVGGRLQTGWLFRFGIELGGWKLLSPK